MNRTMRQQWLAASLIAAASTLAYAAPAAKDAAKPLATVNGKSIPQARADALAAAQSAQGQQDTAKLREAIKEELVRREILVQEAEKKGVEKKPEVQTQLVLTRQNVLINAYLGDYVKNHPVTDEMLKSEYESIRKALGDKEYKARHILLDTENEAKAVVEKLKKGEKFEDLAKQSKDPGSKDRGGELGWANQAAYVKPFSEALIKLEKGKFTETPVKSDFGWHIILLDDSRDMKTPPLDEVKPQLTQRLNQQTVEKHMAELRAKAKVE
jgi:peptidyl-prolyl cis-trans isomerase C